MKNINIVAAKYAHTIGILYNGRQTRTFIDGEEILDAAQTLQHKSYYLKLVTDHELDKNQIYLTTQKINNSLHFDFGMNRLQSRMIFMTCPLVANRYKPGILQQMKNAGYEILHHTISATIAEAIAQDMRINEKLKILVEEYDAVQMSITENQAAINDFIDNVSAISDMVNSSYWRGEDVMRIFFNEFNRYGGKADAGQIFTPDHITSFMYRLIDVHQNDKILDQTTPNMTQRISRIFERKPLISKEI